MGNRFLLFGEKPFDAFALDRFAFIAADIERMSDTEALMYKDTFEELVTKLVSRYCFTCVDVSFENKMVDLIDRHGPRGKHYVAEYSLVVTGDTYYLGLIPFHLVHRKVPVDVEVKGNVMAFEIDTHYHSEDLLPEITAKVKAEYDLIKTYILDSLYNLNQTVMYYNSELEKFIVPLLANKLRKAQRGFNIREQLNFR